MPRQNPQPPPTSESSSHKGNCHCGAVRFSITLSPPLAKYPVNSCNCSICSKNGYLLVYPNTQDMKLESGEEVLKEYRFASRYVRHQFCGECGSSCFIKLPDDPIAPFIAVNVRMLEDFDPDSLTLRKPDGRSFEPAYEPRK
ncbi:hypothetical protein N7528_006306 [Penicillium herquei]|nr:hypothetical protein N7528_006306 [Penicillium herquei]